jgi:hypothetical protein
MEKPRTARSENTLDAIPPQIRITHKTVANLRILRNIPEAGRKVQTRPQVQSTVKTITDKPLPRWWNDVRERYQPEEILRFLQNNRHILEKRITGLDNNSYLYRWVHRLFSLISGVAGIVDRVNAQFLRVLLLVPGVRIGIRKYRDWKNHLNLRELVEFIRAKIYSLRHPPHNEGEMRLIGEIMDYASKHGFDYRKLIPRAQHGYLEKKNQLMQHKYFQEFSKTALERLLATQFSFNRNIFPVLPDSAFWHKFFEFCERKKVVDIILVNKDGERTSLKKGTPERLATTDVMGILERLTAIKNGGRRIFFIGHHEGYLGPYFVRSVIRRSASIRSLKTATPWWGRQFSNVVLRNGAATWETSSSPCPRRSPRPSRPTGLAMSSEKRPGAPSCIIKMPTGLG